MECEVFFSIIIHPSGNSQKDHILGKLLAWGYEQVGTDQLGDEVGRGARIACELTGSRVQAGPVPDFLNMPALVLNGP